MSIRLLQRLYSRPKYLFLSITFLITGALIILDIVHDGFVDALYTIFFAQSLAILITTVAVLFHRGSRKHTLPWMIAAAVTLFYMAGSVFMQYGGPRIATEADGQARVRYACIYGMDSSLVTDIFGDAFDGDNAHTSKGITRELPETICALRYMPLATSNLLFVKNDSYLSSYLVIVAAETFLATAFLTARRYA